MKAIILSAGEGTRVRKINDNLPKVMLNILDRPMLEWNIRLLKKYNVEEIAINTHYKAEKIKDYFGDGKKLGVNIRYSYEESLLGTSGSLNNFRDFFNEPFFVLYGDVISKLNLEKLADFHKKKNSLATLVVQKTDHLEDSDIVKVDKDNRIIELIHKPGNRNFGELGNAALYILEPKILNYIPTGKSDFIKDVFPKIIRSKERIYGYNTDEFIKDAGTPERILVIQEYLKTLN